MPRIRKLDAASTSATLTDERLFTIARLEDEELVADLASRFDGWTPRIDALEAIEKQVAAAVARVSAALTGANAACDVACGDLSEALLADVERDHPRYRGFFRTTFSDFVRVPFDAQVPAMRNWLDTSKDPILEAQRPALEKATARGERALKRTSALETLRAERDVLRRELAEAFTTERDVLHEDLAKRARDAKLPRGWAATFFMTGASTPTKRTPDEKPPEQ